jgi:hypothetical protein
MVFPRLAPIAEMIFAPLLTVEEKRRSKHLPAA